jgi:secondary thiamine-phosphate synthase enzyme
MAVASRNIHIKTSRENDIIDITEQTSRAVKESKMKNGIVTVFVSGSTAAITTLEYEPGLKTDFPNMLSRVAPKGIEYEHDKTWHDGNGHSHVRASSIGPSLTIPFREGQMMLGSWQQIVLIEMDAKPRERRVILQMMGE